MNVSIVTYQTKIQDLLRLFDCILGDELIEKVFIIDNSPTDELKYKIHKLSPKLTYIFGHGNIGYGSAHNIAIRKSLSYGVDYHVVLNPDIYFGKDVLAELKSFMDREGDVGAVMPKIIYPDGEIQFLCKCMPRPLDLFGRRFIKNKNWVEKNNYRYELRKSGYDKLLNVPCLSGCFMFLKVDALKDVGLFDEKIFMYLEDYDLYRRLHQKYKTIYYPFVTVIHEHAKESYKNKKLLKAHIKSSIYYFNKWGWFFDRKRKKFNKIILKEIGYI